MVKLDILLASFNGEKYIESQILSLLAQSYKNWKLIVHDDGSSDNTIAIIKKYQSLDNRVFLIEDNVTKLGPALNFLHLLKFSESEFCMFCDQDDIWLENKVEVMLSEIALKNQQKPQLVYSNSYVYSKFSIAGKATLTFPTKLTDLLFLNSGIQGCALIFNNKLREIALSSPSYVYMHDHLICIIAATFGEMSYFDRSLMLYRQHIHTVTGETASSIFDKLLSFFAKGRSVLDLNHYKSVESFLQQYSDTINLDKKSIINAYLMYPSLSLFGRLNVILEYDFKIFNSKILLLLKTLIRKPLNII